MKPKISLEKFLETIAPVEITIGTVKTAERVPKSKKMLKLSVGLGTREATVLTNIGSIFEPEELVGRTFPFVTNLEPAEIMGVRSEAMIMVGSADDGAVDINLQEGSTLT